MSSKSLETDVSTGFTQLVRDDVKKESGDEVMGATTSYKKESKKPGRKFEVTIIEEGLGNFGDCFYYPAEALVNCYKVFEGKKMYANHPSAQDEYNRPERDVRDILGYFENVRPQVIEGRTVLKSDFIINEGEPFDWARTLMRETIDYKTKHPDQEFIGISINASGDAVEKNIDELLKDSKVPDEAKIKLQEAKDKGIETVRYTTKFSDAISVDLVTQAGAGGKINKMLEGEKQMSKHKEAGEMPEAPAKDKKDNDTADAGHSDAGKDAALIADMITKHDGAADAAKEEPTPEETECMKQTAEAYKEMGHSEEEAAKAAEMHQKVEKSMKQKKEKAEADAVVSEPQDAKGQEAKESEEKKENKESEIKLTGRIAFLESELKKVRIEKYVDKKLQESGLSRSTTDQIRKLVGDVKELRNEKEFDAKLNLFLEGYKLKTEVEPFFMGTPEKAGEVVTEISFAECVK